jgi:glycosyltransferase involved in cell wall biosynthesis
MYIKRACLKAVGPFDEEAFGKGYGEENDFCMRAMAAGWRNILAMDTFVYHAGEVSFQEGSLVGKQRGMDALLAKHPDYLLRVASHVSEDPGRAYRAAITAQLWGLSDKPVILLVSHSLGGGTERHVSDLAKLYAQSARVLVVRPASAFIGGGLSLEAVDEYDSFTLDIDIETAEDLTSAISLFGVDRVHIHHLYGFGRDLEVAFRNLKVPFEFTLHDYYAICPQINLSKDGIHYCGEPDAGGCNACIRANPKFGARDIRSWRMAHEWLLRDAARVITPSVDASERIERYAPDAALVPIYHEEQRKAWLDAESVAPLAPGEVMRIAVLGVLAEHKGRQLVIDAARGVVTSDLAMEFIIIGDPFGELPPRELAAIRSTGRYREADLQQLISDIDPHLILFASQWPETYSYTLTAALTAGRPIMAPELGAFPERLEGRNWSFSFDWRTDGAGLIVQLSRVRAANFETGIGPHPPHFSSKQTRALGPDAGYQPLASRSQALTPAPRAKILTVLAVLEREGDVPSPCASIRLVGFLDDLGRRGLARVRYVDPSEVARYEADVLITHRASVDDLASARALLDLSHRRGIPLVYDLDDNLYDLDPNAEGGKYRKLLEVVHAFVAGATAVLASTPILAARLLAAGAKNVHVHKNLLDPELWGKPIEDERCATADKVRLLYMGTRTHGEDFTMIAPALKKLKAVHGKKIEIALIGVCSDDPMDSYLSFITPPPVVGGSYPAFVSWIRTLPSFDIGISPLRSNPFNSCKSDIKLLDYAALGMVPVLSDLEPYRATVQHGKDGFLVPDSSDAWFATLDELVRNADLRERVRHNARRHYVAAEFATGADERLETLVQVAGLTSQ